MSNKPAPDTSSRWNDSHTHALLKGIIEIVLANCGALYQIPDLADQSGNYGNKINSKTQQILRNLVAGSGVGHGQGDMVGELAGKGAGRAGKGANGKKDSKSPGGSPSKKRKVKEEVKEELGGSEEEVY